MKRVFVLLGIFAVLSPLVLLVGCSDNKQSKEESEALKNASNVSAAKSGPNENPNKPRLAPPPP